MQVCIVKSRTYLPALPVPLSPQCFFLPPEQLLELLLGRGGAIVRAGAAIPRGCVLGPDTVVGKGVSLPQFTRCGIFISEEWRWWCWWWWGEVLFSVVEWTRR